MPCESEHVSHYVRNVLGILFVCKKLKYYNFCFKLSMTDVLIRIMVQISIFIPYHFLYHLNYAFLFNFVWVALPSWFLWSLIRETLHKTYILKSRWIGHFGDRNWSHVLLTREAVHDLCVWSALLCLIEDIYELNYLRSFDQDSWGQIVTTYLDNKRKGWERKEIFKLKLSPSAWITLYRRSLTLQAKCHLDLKSF